nr:MAG TPA_asm: hypothetical protein [Caudoviricetes sp.]
MLNAETDCLQFCPASVHGAKTPFYRRVPESIVPVSRCGYIRRSVRRKRPPVARCQTGTPRRSTHL